MNREHHASAIPDQRVVFARRQGDVDVAAHFEFAGLAIEGGLIGPKYQTGNFGLHAARFVGHQIDTIGLAECRDQKNGQQGKQRQLFHVLLLFRRLYASNRFRKAISTRRMSALGIAHRSPHHHLQQSLRGRWKATNGTPAREVTQPRHSLAYVEGEAIGCSELRSYITRFASFHSNLLQPHGSHGIDTRGAPRRQQAS